jgi:hypothetical protein
VNLVPESPSTLQPLECLISQASTDPDLDPVTYEFRWFGEDVLIGDSGSTLDPSETVAGMTVYCEARASDGFDSSGWARSPSRAITPPF